MKIEIKVPSVGESITEATIGSWNKKTGESVKKNDVVLALETDKASVEVIAEQDGVLTTQADAGQVVKIGSVVGFIDSDAKASAAPTASAPSASPAQASVSPAQASVAPSNASAAASSFSPAVQRIITEKGIDPTGMQGTGKDGRLTKGDLLNPVATPVAALTPVTAKSPAAPALFPSGNASSKQGEKKLVPMTTIRKKIAERLVQAKNTTAMLTTFNEIDMSRIIDLRNRYKDQFKEKYQVSLGFMGILIEHYAGVFPLWIAPVQVVVIPVRDSHNDYAERVFNTLKASGIRVELDTADANLGTKVREAKNNKIPYWIVIGDKEIEADSVEIESRDEGVLGSMKIDIFVSKILDEIKNKK